MKPTFGAIGFTVGTYNNIMKSSTPTEQLYYGQLYELRGKVLSGFFDEATEQEMIVLFTRQSEQAEMTIVDRMRGDGYNVTYMDDNDFTDKLNQAGIDLWG